MTQVQQRNYGPYYPEEPDPTLADEGPRRINFLKWGLGCAGLTMILFAGITMLVLIITPIWFRGLPTSEQVIWINRIPLLEGLKPTRVYNAELLPTKLSDDQAVKALLETPDPGATDGPDMAGGVLAAGDDPGAGQAVRTPTATATRSTPAPTSILATDTPVLAPLLATPTLIPTRAAALLPSPTTTATLPPPPIATQIPAPPSYQAVGYKFVKQTWNTCGPANLTQALNYMGWPGSKEQVIDYLKPTTEDRNVSPWEMVNYVNEYLNKEKAIKAIMRYGGDMNLLKRLVSNGFGVIIEKGYFVAGEGWMGHYLTLQGYDDSRGQMHGLDTYLGDRWEDYSELDTRWQQFNRVFLVLYPADRDRELASVLGPYHDVNYGYRMALSRAREEASEAPDNPYTWFNLGTSYTLLGDFSRAADAFDRARDNRAGDGLPWRMLWYQFAPYEAYYNDGQYNEVLSLAEATLNTSADLEESHYWRGMALAALDDTNGAARAFQKALNINPRFWPASDRLNEVKNGTFRPPQ